MAARGKQTKRFKGTKLVCNADMGTKDIRKFCKLDQEVEEKLMQLSNYYHLSARAHMKTIKIARTIADLANEENISISHITQAIQFRISGEERQY